MVIPTVWPVSTHNSRLEISRHLLDKDKVNTNIIMSEYPRAVSECRTLSGRFISDIGIRRFIFGVKSTATKRN